MASQQPGHQATSRSEIPGNYEPVVNEHFQAPAHNLDNKQAEQVIRLAESSHQDAQGGSIGNFSKRDHHGQSASEYAGPNAGLTGTGSTHSHGAGIPAGGALAGDVHGRREHHGQSASEFSGPANPIAHQPPSYPSQAGNVGANRTHHGMSASEYLPPSGTGAAHTKDAHDLGRALHDPSKYTEPADHVSGVSHPRVAAVEPGSATSTAHYDISQMGANANRGTHDGHLHSQLAGGAAGAGALASGAGIAGAAHQTPMHPTGQAGTGSTGHSTGLAEAAGTTGATVPGAGHHSSSTTGVTGSSTTGGEQSIADKLRGELERNAQKSGTHASGMGTHGAAKDLNL